MEETNNPVGQARQRFDRMLDRFGIGRQRPAEQDTPDQDETLSEVVGDEGGSGTSAGGTPYSRSGRGLGRVRPTDPLRRIS
jgi:hypothetical protein